MAKINRILITGGAGFIGSNYVRYLCRTHPECHVVVLDKLTYAGNKANLDDVSDAITFLQGDIAEPADVREAMEGCDAVVNFAAESHVDRSLLDASPFIRTNVVGTFVLLEVAHELGVNRFLQISTDEVYGDMAGTSHRSVEVDLLRPRSPYAASKAAAEHLVFSYGISHKMNVVITRGSNTYGPYQYPEKIIPLFITNAVENRYLPVYNDGSAVRDYMHVEDHCTGIDIVLRKGESGQAYNLGVRLEISGLEVARRIVDLLDKPRELIKQVPDRPGHDYRYSVNPTRAEELGWKPKWSWPSGLAQTILWYQQNGPWWRAVKQKQDFHSYEQRWYATLPQVTGVCDG